MRCDGCGRRWHRPARFCGRCGAALSQPDPPHPTRRQTPGRRTASVLAVAALLAVAAIAVSAVQLPGTRPASTVEVPTTAVASQGDPARAAARAPRPADCGEHLQELPHAIRRPGLHLGALEWRDGRLCAPVRPRDRTVPRCDPPQLACTVP